MTYLIQVQLPFIIIFSTTIYYYLHYKTKISIKYLFIDNVAVIIASILATLLTTYLLPEKNYWLRLLTIPLLILGFTFILTMFRFWRTPKRKITANENEIISPADGNIIYYHKLEENETPTSYKKGIKATLDEVLQTDLLKVPCWIIGINMTPFDVHKNCSPISGEILLNKHIKGKFQSLKNPDAIVVNERQTVVIKNEELTIGIVQTASRLVRRIDSYINAGDFIKRGDWYGMIRFGSQVDVILPQEYLPTIEIGQQVFAAKTILASK